MVHARGATIASPMASLPREDECGARRVSYVVLHDTICALPPEEALFDPSPHCLVKVQLGHWMLKPAKACTLQPLDVQQPDFLRTCESLSHLGFIETIRPGLDSNLVSNIPPTRCRRAAANRCVEVRPENNEAVTDMFRRKGKVCGVACNGYG